MAQPKKSRRKCATVGTNPRDLAKSRANYANWALGAATTTVSILIGLRSTNMDPLNVILIGGGVLWVWVAIKYSRFSRRPWAILKTCQKTWNWWAGLLLITVAFTVWATYEWNGGRSEIIPTNGDVLRAIEETGQKTADDLGKMLQSMLSSVTATELSRLASDYPLGHVLIAFSGEIKKVLPYTNVVESDWDNLDVHREKNNTISVLIPYVRDVRSHSMATHLLINLDAWPGAKSRALQFKNLEIWTECLKTEPIGRCVVLGFREGWDRGVKGAGR